MKNRYPMDVVAKVLRDVLDYEAAHGVDRALAGAIADQESGMLRMIGQGLPQICIDRRRKLVAITDPVVLCDKQINGILHELRK